jgi:hypothetical protein
VGQLCEDARRVGASNDGLPVAARSGGGGAVPPEPAPDRAAAIGETRFPFQTVRYSMASSKYTAR